MTTSGIYGFVTALDGDIVWLEIADGIEIRMARGAVASILQRKGRRDRGPCTGDAHRRPDSDAASRPSRPTHDDARATTS